jgi:hypothetical protein
VRENEKVARRNKENVIIVRSKEQLYCSLTLIMVYNNYTVVAIMVCNYYTVAIIMVCNNYTAKLR